MPRVTCGFCGLPFRVRAVHEGATCYCCSGCALAASIPVHDGALPVSRGLIAALAIGFGVFNQILFAALAAAVTGEGRAGAGEILALVSLALGAPVLAASLAAVMLSRQRGWTDAVAAAVAAAGGLLAARAAWVAPLEGLAWLLSANVALGAWTARGWIRRALVSRRRGPK